MSKKRTMEASAEVLDGEVYITWSDPGHKPRDQASPTRKQVRELEEKNRQETYGQRQTFTVYKGRFKFFFRKSLYECEGQNGRPVVRVSGEFYQDPEWSRKVYRTQVVL